MRSRALLLPLALLIGCSADPGTRPNDMSAGTHEATARKLDADAAATNDSSLAKKDRKVASEHRDASRELLDAEAKACAGVAATDQDACPFRPGGDVREVNELRAEIGQDRGVQRLVGAGLVLPATPTRTKESLERLVSCNLAHNAVRGGPAPEAADCPTAVHGTTVEVHKTDKGLQVNLHGDDADHAAELVRRSRALLTAPR